MNISAPSFITTTFPVPPPHFINTTVLPGAESASKRLKSESTDDINDYDQQIPVISEEKFYQYFEIAKGATDPFIALTRFFTSIVVNGNNIWSCIVRLDSGVHLECQLALDRYKSSYKRLKPKPQEQHYYIDVYEHNNDTHVTSNEELVSIRISPDYEEGEWKWIRKGMQFSGSQSKRLAEIISRSMRIKNCFLADNAYVPGANPEDQIFISPMLQLMGKASYYEPTFSLYECHDFETNIRIRLGKERRYASQNKFLYNESLKWLQELKISIIYADILKNCAKERKNFVRIVQLVDKTIANSQFIPNSELQFGKLLLDLYEMSKNGSIPAKKGYEWIHFQFFTDPNLPRETENQNRFYKATDMLTYTIRHANFA